MLRKFLVKTTIDIFGDLNKFETSVKTGTVAEVRELVDAAGCDVNKPFNGGNPRCDTPLHSAARYNINVDVLEYLVSKGANVNARKGDNQYTPLHCAAESNTNVGVLKCLISYGADIHARSNGGHTPLHCAVISNPNIGVLQYLVSQGVDIHARSNGGYTPLHHAIRNPDVGVLKYLISQGADVNAKTSDGKTPLDILNIHRDSYAPSKNEKMQILHEAMQLYCKR